MVVIGLTGGSGSGKSTVASLMAHRGIKIIDADKISHDVVKKGEKALEEIVERYGKDILLKNGELDRKKLAAIVFSDKDELRVLNKITHKYISEIIKAEVAKNDTDICVIDAPVLKESGLDKICDYIIAVTADKDIRIKRITERDGISEKEAKDRIASQMSDELYSENADFIIDNSGLLALDMLLDDIMRKIGGSIISEK